MVSFLQKKKKWEFNKKAYCLSGSKIYNFRQKIFKKNKEKFNKNKNCIISCGGADKKIFYIKLPKF